MRFNERSLVVLIGGGLAAVVVVAVGLYLLLGDGDGSGDSNGNPVEAGSAAGALAGGPDEVLYLSGTALIRRDIGAETEEQVGKVPSSSVYAAPGSPWLAYVTSKPSPDDDFSVEPVLHLYDTATNEKSRHGAGVAPVWNASGTHVAFLRPVEPRECQGETCSGDSQIGVVEAATGRESLLLEPANYSILGWGGDWIHVSDFEDPARVISVSLAEERAELDMPASQYWAASPDGRWAVKTNAKKTEFIALDGGELSDERIPVDLGDLELLEGAWAHDSSGVAAVTSSVADGRGKGKKKRADEGESTTQVVTFSPDDPKPRPVAGSTGAMGTIYWTVESEAVVFATLVDPRRALFQAKHCPIRNSKGCTIVTSWTEGVSLLRSE